MWWYWMHTYSSLPLPCWYTGAVQIEGKYQLIYVTITKRKSFFRKQWSSKNPITCFPCILKPTTAYKLNTIPIQFLLIKAIILPKNEPNLKKCPILLHSSEKTKIFTKYKEIHQTIASKTNTKSTKFEVDKFKERTCPRQWRGCWGKYQSSAP